MVTLALMYDCIQIGLDVAFLGLGFTVNWIISIWAWLTFFTWFKIKGVSFHSWKNAASLNGGGFFEIIPLPIIASLPLWTASVTFIILNHSSWKKTTITTPGSNKK